MPKVTLKDIAERAGVHPSTVSRALDPNKSGMVKERTLEEIRQVAADLGYRIDTVARGLRRGRTHTLAVVVADLGNPFIAPVVRGIENNLDGRGLMAIIAETQDDHGRMNRVLDSLLARRVDAIIVTAARDGDTRLLKTVSKEVPVVLAVRSLPGSGIPEVTHDDVRGGQLAADHLIDTGHSRVAQLCGPGDISSFRGRAKGFRERVLERGVELIDVDEPGTHPIWPEGRRLMQLVLDGGGDLPTGIFAHNDLMAFGALESLRNAGLKCPRDVAVMGYNDTVMTNLTDPPMTTVKLHGYELGRVAADTAVMLIEENDRQSSSLSLPPELVPRRSTVGWTKREASDVGDAGAS